MAVTLLETAEDVAALAVWRSGLVPIDQVDAVACDVIAALRSYGMIVTFDDPTADTPGKKHRGARDTESQAAQFVWPKTGTQREKVLRALHGTDGLTDEEVAAATGLYLYSAAPRRTELCEQGWVTDSGQRRPTKNKCSAIVWTLTLAAEMEGRRRALW